MPQTDTHATLRIGNVNYSGRSSGQYGHAEMDALHSYLGHGNLKKLLRTRLKTVSCPEVPVCAPCAAVLQTLGFRPTDGRTEFSNKKSKGGVSWGLSLRVRQALEAEFGAATVNR